MADGLVNTSMWVAKILAPSDAEENDTTKQFLKMGQAALMDGWLSNIPFIAMLLFFMSVIVAFFYHWWVGIIMLLVSAFVAERVSMKFVRSVSYYLPFLYHKMINRATNYKKKNDFDRLEASKSYCEDLKKLIDIYKNSKLKPPTKKRLEDIPYDDLYYWLETEKA